MVNLVDIVLLLFLVVIAVAIVRMHNLFAAVMLAGIYSLLMASIFVILDAVDVAFTEAAVGAGISTVLMLGTLSLTKSREKIHVRPSIIPLIVVVATGAMLLYGASGMPEFNDPNAPVHQHVAPRYINVSPVEIGVPNMVTSVLASYRGYDTLGELTVIFTAGVGVLLLLGRRRRSKKANETEDSASKEPEVST
ncbi:MAG: DUF4040 domain-containing protein [Alphaproteobacteria bacterium]|nr:DUF4040 domain-containing protein [Alphaproteobacteria bacterium]MBT4020719.1 DUF4040 domain-containing protein [Alphaproteobacteria bacterium]MBT4965167.1 DUF4040 domain-containing protein [Alphaproteobacteria bacterium]MBT5159652.1 DUF4040 domain-containing protein [Alphaproteobacteria bacterium]MBT5917615.1 DUF4040 domain-containing protein [Alphaproteobacteria bacterium]